MLDLIAGSEKSEINAYLSRFLIASRPNYYQLLKVPGNERLPALKSILGEPSLIKILTIPISQCLRAAGIDNLELACDIGNQILMECEEDNLSLQDISLFAREFTGGKYGKNYGQLTQLAFMEMFEQYRQARHEAMMEIRLEEQANHKALGPAERRSDDQEEPKNLFREAMKDYIKNNNNENT